MIYKNIVEDKQVQKALQLLVSDDEQGRSSNKELTLDYNYILAKKWVSKWVSELVSKWVSE